MAEESLWAPKDGPKDGGDDDVLASSPLWEEAMPVRIRETIRVHYASGIVKASPESGMVWVDLEARVLVGWHGTVQPPRGMDTWPMVNDTETHSSFSLEEILEKRNQLTVSNAQNRHPSQ